MIRSVRGTIGWSGFACFGSRYISLTYLPMKMWNKSVVAMEVPAVNADMSSLTRRGHCGSQIAIPKGNATMLRAQDVTEKILSRLIEALIGPKYTATFPIVSVRGAVRRVVVAVERSARRRNISRRGNFPAKMNVDDFREYSLAQQVYGIIGQLLENRRVDGKKR